MPCERARRDPLSLPPCDGAVQRRPSSKQEVGLHQTAALWALLLDAPASRTMRNVFPLCRSYLVCGILLQRFGQTCSSEISLKYLLVKGHYICTLLSNCFREKISDIGHVANNNSSGIRVKDV